MTAYLVEVSAYLTVTDSNGVTVRWSLSFIPLLPDLARSWRSQIQRTSVGVMSTADLLSSLLVLVLPMRWFVSVG